MVVSPPVKYFYWPFEGGTSLVDHFLFMSCICHAFASVHSALWSPAGRGLTSWLLFVMFNCVFGTFPCGILGQAWYFIVSIPDLCRLS